ncbi:hypothetical protein QUF75_14255 [Desulfococcaceae bacterium HSG7]|nr:hypothetical protein [Desulfococcaceae bacterium HSG7]
MKAKVMVGLVGAMVLMSLQISSVTAAGENLNLTEYYSAIIDELVMKCKYKTAMRYSKSDTIQNAAMLSCLKTTFYKKNKKNLIRAMIEENIGIKRYKVRYYLNTQFYNIVRPSRVRIM